VGLLIRLCVVFILSTSIVYANESSDSTNPGTEPQQQLVELDDTLKTENEVVSSNTESTHLSKARAPEYDPITSWPIVVATLFAMVVFIFVLAWFARRFSGFNIAKNREMEVLSSLPLGAREKVSLVRVKGQTLLLGVTNQQISCLHTFDSDSDLSDNAQEGGGRGAHSDFSTTLKGLLTKSTPEEQGSSELNSQEGKL
jgi:flagellar biosynthetic protein FliO